MSIITTKEDRVRRGRFATARPGAGIVLLLCVLATGCLAEDDLVHNAREHPRARVAAGNAPTPTALAPTPTALAPTPTALAPTPAAPPPTPTSASVPAAGSAATPAAAPTTAADREVSRTSRTTVALLPAGSGSGRRVVYSISRQRVWTVQADGSVDRTYLVSGRRSQPGPGTFRVYSRSRHTASAVSDETMEFMVRFTRGRRTGAPIGFHSIPVDHNDHPAQTVAQLGQPLSAGCIRQRKTDAAYLWAFAPVGTKVVVVR